MRRLASAIALSFVCSRCASGGAGAPPTNPSSSSPLAGKLAPDFSRPDLNGAPFSLSMARGKVAVVKFIAKHCVPCQRTLPAVERLHLQHPDITIVGISEDDNEDDARSLASVHRVTFPIVYDSGNVLAGRYRVTELPMTFVVGRAGAIVWVGGPEKSEDDLTRAVLAAR